MFVLGLKSQWCVPSRLSQCRINAFIIFYIFLTLECLNQSHLCFQCIIAEIIYMVFCHVLTAYFTVFPLVYFLDNMDLEGCRSDVR